MVDKIPTPHELEDLSPDLCNPGSVVGVPCVHAYGMWVHQDVLTSKEDMRMIIMSDTMSIIKLNTNKEDELLR